MRPCEDCQACCQGWLIGDAYGIPFSKGKPCAFLKEKCMIYTCRPSVCKKYYCAWAQELFPEWMQPNKCNVLITVQNWSKGQYLRCSEMGQKMGDNVFAEILNFCKKNSCPYVLQYDGHVKVFGPQEFIEEIKS